MILRKTTRDKLVSNAISATKFHDIAEQSKLFQKLKVRVKPQLQEIDYYRIQKSTLLDFDPLIVHGVDQDTLYDFDPADPRFDKELDSTKKPSGENFSPLAYYESDPNYKKLFDSGRQLSTLDNIFGDFHEGHVTFIGPAGSGKTTLLKALTEDINGGKFNHHDVIREIDIAHFFNLKSSKKGDLITLEELLFQNVEPQMSKEEMREALEYVISNPKTILFILDSLDTLPFSLSEHCYVISVYERAPVEVVLWNLLTNQLIPGCRMITSSREHTIRDFEGDLRPTKVVLLAGLSTASMEKIVCGYCEEMKGHEIMKYIESKPVLKSLCTTPLFLVLCLMGLEDNSEFRPTTLSGIMALLLQVLIRSEHVHQKNIEEVIDKLKSLSFDGTKEGRVIFSSEELTQHGLEENQVTDFLILRPDHCYQKPVLGHMVLFFGHQIIQDMLSGFWILQMNLQEFENTVKNNINATSYIYTRRLLCGFLLNESVFEIASQFLDPIENVVEKASILKQHLANLTENISEKEHLELLVLLSEAGNGLEDMVKSTLHKIKISDNQIFGVNDMAAIAQVLKHCEKPELDLPNCGLTDEHLCTFLELIMHQNMKLQVFDISDNSNIGLKGMKAVAGIVSQTSCPFLKMQNCGLGSKHLKAFLDHTATCDTKVSTLDIRGYAEDSMGNRSVLGETVHQCGVKYLRLYPEDLHYISAESFGISLQSSKLQNLDLRSGLDDESSVFENESYIEFVEDLCKFLPYVTGEINMEGYNVPAHLVSKIQYALDRGENEDLKIVLGQYFCQTLEVGKIGIDSKTERISKATGGTVALYGCKLKIQPNHLESDSDVCLSVISGEYIDIPEGFMVISPTLDCDLSCVKMNAEPEMEVEMQTWCFAEEPHRVVLLSKGNESSNWVQEQTLVLGRNRKLTFKTKKFSRKLFGILRSLKLGWLLSFPMTPHLYYNKFGAFKAYFCLDDELMDDKLREQHNRRGLMEALTMPERMITKIGDKIQFNMECKYPAESRIEQPNRHQFEITESVIDCTFIQRDFMLYPVPDRVEKGFIEIVFKIDKLGNGDLKNMHCRLEWPGLEPMTSPESLKKGGQIQHRGCGGMHFCRHSSRECNPFR